MIMPQNFYELVWIFIIYAFIGWCTEGVLNKNTAEEAQHSF